MCRPGRVFRSHKRHVCSTLGVGRGSPSLFGYGVKRGLTTKGRETKTRRPLLGRPRNERLLSRRPYSVGTSGYTVVSCSYNKDSEVGVVLTTQGRGRLRRLDSLVTVRNTPQHRRKMFGMGLGPEVVPTWRTKDSYRVFSSHGEDVPRTGPEFYDAGVGRSRSELSGRDLD